MSPGPLLAFSTCVSKEIIASGIPFSATVIHIITRSPDVHIEVHVHVHAQTNHSALIKGGVLITYVWG